MHVAGVAAARGAARRRQQHHVVVLRCLLGDDRKDGSLHQSKARHAAVTVADGNVFPRLRISQQRQHIHAKAHDWQKLGERPTAYSKHYLLDV